MNSQDITALIEHLATMPLEKFIVLALLVGVWLIGRIVVRCLELRYTAPAIPAPKARTRTRPPPKRHEKA